MVSKTSLKKTYDSNCYLLLIVYIIQTLTIFVLLLKISKLKECNTVEIQNHLKNQNSLLEYRLRRSAELNLNESIDEHTELNLTNFDFYYNMSSNNTDKNIRKLNRFPFIQLPRNRVYLDKNTSQILNMYCAKVKCNSTKVSKNSDQNCQHDEHRKSTKESTTPNLERCRLRRIGTPLYNAFTTGSKYGAFLKDSMARKKSRAEKIWVTRGYMSNYLYEYDTMEQIDKNQPPSNVYNLPSSYYGTGHVIFQDSFYYHSYNSPNLILRYDLSLRKILANHTLNLLSNETNPKLCRVYSFHNEHVGCLDFSVDENGLWMIYRNGSRSIIYVAKLNSDDLKVQKRVELQLNTQLSETFSPDFNILLNGFIICGKVYFVQYHTIQNTFIRYVFDLYDTDSNNLNKNNLQAIAFLQPFSQNTQLTYNPFDQLLYAWDSDRMLTYTISLINNI